MKKKQIIGGILGIVVGLLIAFMQPPTGLDSVAMKGLGILICALVWMIAEVMPEYLILLLFCSISAGTGSLTFEEAFNPFSGTSWWLLVGALVIGAAVAHSGLLKRLALYVMKAFPASYLGQFLGITISGVCISPLIPSGTARLAVAGPIAKEISEEMGLEKQSKGATGLFSALYTGFNCTSGSMLELNMEKHLQIPRYSLLKDKKLFYSVRSEGESIVFGDCLQMDADEWAVLARTVPAFCGEDA